jgi:hypothetical protein
LVDYPDCGGRNLPRCTPQFTASDHQDDFDERWLPIKKGDRLPTPFAVTAAQSEVVPPLALLREWLPLATEDDIRQAEAEHHRHRDIYRHGRTYFPSSIISTGAAMCNRDIAKETKVSRATVNRTVGSSEPRDEKKLSASNDRKWLK